MVFSPIWFIFGGQDRVPYIRSAVYYRTVEMFLTGNSNSCTWWPWNWGGRTRRRRCGRRERSPAREPTVRIRPRWRPAGTPGCSRSSGSTSSSGTSASSTSWERAQCPSQSKSLSSRRSTRRPGKSESAFDELAVQITHNKIINNMNMNIPWIKQVVFDFFPVTNPSFILELRTRFKSPKQRSKFSQQAA